MLHKNIKTAIIHTILFRQAFIPIQESGDRQMDDPDITQEYYITDYSELSRQLKDLKPPETMRRNAEDALIEIKKRYQSLIETNLYGIQEIDVQGIIMFANPIQHRLLGYSDGELKGKKVWHLMKSEEDSRALTEYLLKIAKRERVPFPWIARYRKKDGQPVELKTDWNYLRDKKGNISGFISFVSDVVEGKKSGAEDDSDNRYRFLLDSASEIILIFNREGKITYVNQSCVFASGYFEKELLTMNIADLLPPDRFEVLRQKLAGEGDEDVMGDRKVLLYEAELIDRDFRLIPIEISATLMMSMEEEPDILLVARDISERKKLEKERIKDQKSEYLSRLAGGIVGDMNNLFTGIIGNIDLAQMGLSPESKAFKRLLDAREGCEGVRILMRQFTVFSELIPIIKHGESLNSLLRETVKLLITDPKIRCDASLPPDLWPVAFGVEQMGQAFRNIIVNACEAMPSGGTIKISAENITLLTGDEEPGLSMMPGQYVKVSVQDEGLGVSEENLDRIFDPYFSTKKTGTQRGRGLGLTIAYSVIRKHDGYVYAESKSGVRTTIYVYLPAKKKLRQEDKYTQIESGRKEGDMSAKGKILVMDDEEVIRDVAAQMLQQLGYDVITAKDGVEAIALYKKEMENNSPVNAVIIDLSVKEGMGGKEAMLELAKVDPYVRGIISSGYSNDPEMEEYERYGFCGVVDKPYTLKELSRVLEEVLHK